MADDPLSSAERADSQSDTRKHLRVRGAATAFSDLASVSGANGASALLALVSVTIVTHLLRPTQYSILAYISLISGLMVTATASWTATAVTRYGREELELHGSMRATNWARLTIALPFFAGAVAVVVALKLANAWPAELTWPYVAIALGTGLAALAAGHAVNLLEAGGRMKLTAVGLASNRVLAIVAVIFLIVVGQGHSPADIGLAWMLAACAIAAIFLRTVWRTAIWPPVKTDAMLRRMLAFSIPMIAFSVSQYVISGVDVVILGVFRSTRSVGLYAIAYQGYGVLQGLATTATIVLSPLFVSLRAAGHEGVISRYYHRMLPQALFLCAVAVGASAPLVPVAVPLVFGARFGNAAVPLVLLLAAWILYAAASFVAPIIVLHERAQMIAMLNVVAAIVNIGLDLLLVGALGVGIIGPAIATGSALLVVSVGYLYVAAGCIGVRPRLPLAVLLPAFVGIVATLVIDQPLLRLATAIAGAAVVAVGVFVIRRPFAACDVDMLDRLDVPEFIKRPALQRLSRSG